MNEHREIPAASEMRASDTDRQAIVDRLGSAMSEGRINLYEYDERSTRVYESTTYGELEGLCADLPLGSTPGALPTAISAPSSPTPRSPIASRGVVRDLPIWVKILWTIWLTIVLINLVVWTLVSVGGSPKVFWPIWVAGPAGAALLGLSVGATVVRHSRRNAALRRSLAKAQRRSDKAIRR